jgi:magnesium chelatase family protein
MVKKVFTVTSLGLSCNCVEVEVDISRGLPNTVIVGLPDKAIQEAKERVRSAVKNCIGEYPLGKITINLAPANLIKSGSGLDLAIAVGVIASADVITSEISQKELYIGELSLDGTVKAVNGMLNSVMWAKEMGYETIFLPEGNFQEATLIPGLTLIPLKHLQELIDIKNGILQARILEPVELIEKTQDDSELDMKHVYGQALAKRALEIAAAGGHNIFMIGPPGSGKTLLARTFPTILPKLSSEEMLDVTRIYSVAGVLQGGSKLITQRPFRSPHHTSSVVSIIGGGSNLKPGEISLAHRGVLFLDEFAEFSRQTLESLRQPLEDGFVTIARASGVVQYPSNFILVAASNPTPAGFDESDPSSMNTNGARAGVLKYQAKFSGPIMDRIDLIVKVDRPSKDELLIHQESESSELIQLRVEKARSAQSLRYKEMKGVVTNADLSSKQIKELIVLTSEQKDIMEHAITKFSLSARSFTRILKVSRTIADLNGSEFVTNEALLEALQYRIDKGF